MSKYLNAIIELDQAWDSYIRVRGEANEIFAEYPDYYDGYGKSNFCPVRRYFQEMKEEHEHKNEWLAALARVEVLKKNTPAKVKKDALVRFARPLAWHSLKEEIPTPAPGRNNYFYVKHEKKKRVVGKYWDFKKSTRARWLKAGYTHWRTPGDKFAFPVVKAITEPKIDFDFSTLVEEPFYYR